MIGFELAQDQGSYVEIKDVLLAHGKWSPLWSTSFMESLNITDQCSVELDFDNAQVVTPKLQMSCMISELDDSVV